MSILNKIKSFFFEEKKQEQEIIEVPVQEPNTVQVKTIIEHCIICGHPIYEDERYRDFNGHKAHKRCFKRTQRALLNGESIQ